MLSEAHIGEVSLFKAISGKISQGLDLQNQNHSSSERIGQIYSVTGKERSEIDSVQAGDIGAMVDLNLTVPSSETPRIQEAHLVVIHILCDLVEKGLFAPDHCA